ncbi:kinase-like domain-containing protein [Pavlovales sp. CCMP2436]|nr:kinase-like domain-containing protein [Pavlovales sp. CCMP2436]
MHYYSAAEALELRGDSQSPQSMATQTMSWSESAASTCPCATTGRLVHTTSYRHGKSTPNWPKNTAIRWPSLGSRARLKKWLSRSSAAPTSTSPHSVWSGRSIARSAREASARRKEKDDARAGGSAHALIGREGVADEAQLLPTVHVRPRGVQMEVGDEERRAGVDTLEDEQCCVLLLGLSRGVQPLPQRHLEQQRQRQHARALVPQQPRVVHGREARRGRVASRAVVPAERTGDHVRVAGLVLLQAQHTHSCVPLQAGVEREQPAESQAVHRVGRRGASSTLITLKFAKTLVTLKFAKTLVTLKVAKTLVKLKFVKTLVTLKGAAESAMLTNLTGTTCLTYSHSEGGTPGAIAPWLLPLRRRLFSSEWFQPFRGFSAKAQHFSVEATAPRERAAKARHRDLDLDDEAQPRPSRPRPPPATGAVAPLCQAGSDGKPGKPRKTVHQYELHEVLGRGSYGKVKRAVDTRTGSEFAVKILKKSFLKRQRRFDAHTGVYSTGYEDLLREVAILKKLDHANVVRLVEVLDDPAMDKMYLVLQLVRGGPVLSQSAAAARCADSAMGGDGEGGGGATGGGGGEGGGGLGARKPLSEAEARACLQAILEGLEYLHFQGIVHRDIKPDNILRDKESGRFLICDLGVSLLADDGGDVAVGSAGTPAYSPPEVLRRDLKAYSGRAADVWSLGVTLYELLTGRLPFEADGLDALAELVATAEPLQLPPPGSAGAPSAGAVDLLQRMLRKAPAERITVAEARGHPWVMGEFFSVDADVDLAMRVDADVLLLTPAGRAASAEGGSPLLRIQISPSDVRSALLELNRSLPLPLNGALRTWLESSELKRRLPFA